jgi:ribosomal-protein-alanine N-acetyltransferase
MIARNRATSRKQGYGHWALEAVGVAPFIGTAGLAALPFQESVTPRVMIAWRLARAYWGCGYGTEAGRAILSFAFEEIGLEEVVAFTVPANQRSRAVMERLGMTRSPEDDFNMPDLPEGHPLRRQIFYRLPRSLFNA